MTKLSATLCSFCAIHEGGIDTLQGRTAWEQGQAGPSSISRSQVLSTPYMAFGKLNLPDKLAFSAAALTLRDHTLIDPSQTAIFLAIPAGSLSTDRAYSISVEEGAPSPALFSATLPSSAVADIAIFHHLKGPNVVSAGGDAPFLSLLEYAILSIGCGKCTEALLLFIDETPEHPYDLSVKRDCVIEDGVTTPSPFALALLLGRMDATQNSMVISLERRQTASCDANRDSDALRGLVRPMQSGLSVQIPVCDGGFIGYISLQHS